MTTPTVSTPAIFTPTIYLIDHLAAADPAHEMRLRDVAEAHGLDIIVPPKLEDCPSIEAYLNDHLDRIRQASGVLINATPDSGAISQADLGYVAGFAQAIGKTVIGYNSLSACSKAPSSGALGLFQGQLGDIMPSDRSGIAKMAMFTRRDLGPLHLPGAGSRLADRVFARSEGNDWAIIGYWDDVGSDTLTYAPDRISANILLSLWSKPNPAETPKIIIAN